MKVHIILLLLSFSLIHAMEPTSSRGHEFSHSCPKSMPSLFDLCRKKIVHQARRDSTLQEKIASCLPGDVTEKIKEPFKVASWQENYTNITNTIVWLDHKHLLYFDFSGAKVFKLGKKGPIARKDDENWNLASNNSVAPNNTFVLHHADGGINIADIQTGRQLAYVETSQDYQSHLAISPDSTLCAFNGPHEIYLLDTVTRQLEKYIRPAEDHGTLMSIAFSPDNTLVAYGTGTGTLQLLSRKDGKLRSLERINPLAHTYISTLAFSPDGHYLVAGFHDAALYIIDMQDHTWHNINPSDLENYAKFNWSRTAPATIQWAPDSRHFATLDANGTIAIWTAPNYLYFPVDTSSKTPQWKQQFNTLCDYRKRIAQILHCYCVDRRFAPLALASEEDFEHMLQASGAPEEVKFLLRDRRLLMRCPR